MSLSTNEPTIIASGSTYAISSGMYISALTVTAGGKVTVGSDDGSSSHSGTDAFLNNVVISNGGEISVHADGSLSSATIKSGGTVSLLSNGSFSTREEANNLIVEDGGSLHIDVGVGVTNLVASSGAQINIGNNSNTSAHVEIGNAVLNDGVVISLSSNTQLNDVSIEGDVTISASGNGSLDGITVTSGATLNIEGYPSTIYGLTIQSGGTVSGADGVLIALPDDDDVYDYNICALSSGKIVSSGLVVTRSYDDTTVEQTIFNSSISDITLSSGYDQILGSGTTTLSNITVAAGAELDDSASTINGATITAGGLLDIDDRATLTNFVMNGGELDVEGPGFAAGLPSSDTPPPGAEVSGGIISAGLICLYSAGVTASGLNLASGVQIETDLDYTSGATATVSSDGILTVTSDDETLSVGLAGDYAHQTFLLTQDTAYDTVVVTVDAPPTTVLSGLNTVSTNGLSAVNIASSSIISADLSDTLTLTVTQTGGTSGSFVPFDFYYEEQPVYSSSSVTLTSEASTLERYLDMLQWKPSGSFVSGSTGSADFSISLSSQGSILASGAVQIEINDAPSYIFNGGTYTVNSSGETAHITASTGQIISGGGADLLADITSAHVLLNSSEATGSSTLVSHGGNIIEVGKAPVIYAPGNNDLLTMGGGNGSSGSGHITISGSNLKDGGRATINVAGGSQFQSVVNDEAVALSINAAPNSNLNFQGQNTIISFASAGSGGTATLSNAGSAGNTVAVGNSTITDTNTGSGSDRFVMGSSDPIDATNGQVKFVGGQQSIKNEVDITSGSGTQTVDSSESASRTIVFGGNSTVDYTGGNGLLVANGDSITSEWYIHGVDNGSNQFWQGTGSATVNAAGYFQDIMGTFGSHEEISITGNNATANEEIDDWGVASSTQTIEQSGNNNMTLFGGHGTMSISASNALLVLNGEGTGAADIASTGSTETWVGDSDISFLGNNSAGNDRIYVTGSGNQEITDTTVGSATGSITIDELLPSATGNLTFIGGARHATIWNGVGNSTITAGSGGLTLQDQSSGDTMLDVSLGIDHIYINGNLAGNALIKGATSTNATFKISDVTSQHATNGNYIFDLENGNTITFQGITSEDQIHLFS